MIIHVQTVNSPKNTTFKQLNKLTIMKSTLIKSSFILFLLMGFLTSCGGSPTLCDCLTTEGDLPSGCEQVFKDKYGTTDPSTSQMKNDYYKCK